MTPKNKINQLYEKLLHPRRCRVCRNSPIVFIVTDVDGKSDGIPEAPTVTPTHSGCCPGCGRRLSRMVISEQEADY